MDSAAFRISTRITSVAVSIALALTAGRDVCAAEISRPEPTIATADAWSALGLGTNAAVLALVADGNGNLYVSGDFTTAGGMSANYIARWNGTAWSPLGTGTDASVRSMAIGPNDELYVGGDFNFAGGIAASRVAKWDGSNWSALGAGIGGGTVGTMAVDNSGNLYVGGNYNATQGTHILAKWDGSAWSSLGSGVDGTVYVVATDGTNLYAGGLFNNAGGSPAAHIAKWDGANWLTLGTGVNGFVSALAVGPDGLYVGGSFTNAGGVGASRVARWDGANWWPVGAGMDNNVHDLVFGAGGILYAGGEFTTADNLDAKRNASWNGSAWSGLGTGTDDYVLTLASVCGGVYVGGALQHAGGQPASYVAAWKALFRDADGDGYGDSAEPTLDCSLSGYVANNTDCDDANAAVNPGETDWCDGFDNNCNGLIDEGSHAGAPGLIAWWKGEDNERDATVSHDGSTVGNLAYAAGHNGRAFSYNGSNGYVAVPADPEFDITAAITLEAWIKTTQGFNKYIVTKGESSFYLALGPVGAPGTNKLSFWLNGVTTSWVQGTTNVNDGQWHYVVGTYDGAFMKVYVDGQLENSVAKTGAIATGSDHVYIGRRPSEGLFDGLIDDLAISSRALSAQEINSIYLNSRCGTAAVECALVPPGQVAWWKLDGNGNDQMAAHAAVPLGPGGYYAAGQVGQGFHPEVGTILQVADAPELNPANLTIDAWVRLDELPPGSPVIVWKGDADGIAYTSPYELAIYGSTMGSIAGHATGLVANNGAFDEVIAGIPVPIGAWFHIALTADGSTVNLYQNGQLVGSRAQTLTIGPSNYPLQIGGTTALTAGNYFPGTIDEVELHAVAATAAQIQAIYDAGPAGKCITPVDVLVSPVERGWMLRVESNPSRGRFDLSFAVPQPQPVQLDVYDAAGRHICSLAKGPVPVGLQHFTWDGRTRTGARAAAGVYFARLRIAGRTGTARLVLLR